MINDKIKELEGISSSRCSLISYYISPKSSVDGVVKALEGELTHAPIYVQSNLKKVLMFVKNFDKFPDNGIIIFAGDKESITYLVPEKPVALDLYRCDTKYFLDILKVL